MKLTDRTLVTAPLLDASLVHLVQGGASWKATISQLFDYLFKTRALVLLTFTGTPQTEMVMIVRPIGTTVVPIAAVSGQASYSPLGGICVDQWNYNETPSDTGVGIITLSFDNVAHFGTASFGPGAMAKLTTLSFPALVSTGVSFAMGGTGMPALTTLSIPLLAHVGFTFGPGVMNALTTLSAPSLISCSGNFQPNTMNLLTTFSFPLLAAVGVNFAPATMAVLTTIDLPSLITIGGNFAPATMALLTTLTAANLVRIGGTFAPTTMAVLTTLSFPALTIITGAVSTASMALLATFSLAGMVTYGSTISIPSASCANVASVTLGTIGTLKAITGATITLSGLKIPSANVNAILALLVSLDGTNGTTLWGAGKTLTINGGTNGAPSGQGITDKTTLQARGATITTN